MPESGNVHTLLGMTDTIDHPVRTDDDFPDGSIIKLRNDATQLGEISQPFRVADEKLTEPHGAFRRVQRDVSHDVPKVATGRKREGYLRGLPDNP